MGKRVLPTSTKGKDNISISRTISLIWGIIRLMLTLMGIYLTYNSYFLGIYRNPYFKLF